MLAVLTGIFMNFCLVFSVTEGQKVLTSLACSLWSKGKDKIITTEKLAEVIALPKPATELASD